MKISHCENRQLIVPCSLPGLDWQIDPYIGCEHHCYYCYALNRAETNWDEEISIHSGIQDKLLFELQTLKPQTIYFGYNTDPYQPKEAELLQTRKILEILHEKGFSASILTKSNLVERDIDILSDMPNANVSVSVSFTDDKLRKLFEANTISTELRINALDKIKEANISTSSLICPVIPLISEPETLLSRLAGKADRIWVYGLSLDNPNELPARNVRRILDENFPEKANEIYSIINDKNHYYWIDLRKKFSNIKNEQNLDLRLTGINPK